VVAADLREAWQRAHAADLPPLDHETIDEAAIITRWLLRHDGSPAILPLPTDDAPANWRALAVAIQAARPAEEIWEVDEIISQEDEAADAFDADNLFVELEVALNEDAPS